MTPGLSIFLFLVMYLLHGILEKILLQICGLKDIFTLDEVMFK